MAGITAMVTEDVGADVIRTKVTFEDKSPKQKVDLPTVLRKLKGSYVSVGVHDDAGTYPDGVSVVEVALWNEFGTTKIPARSFFNATLDQNKSQINQWREKLLSQVLDGSISLEKALESLGFRIQQMIQSRITSYDVPPPNAPSTIEQKKSDGVTPPDMPLYHTGLLLRSITYKVVT